jgi:hypothetical protein
MKATVLWHVFAIVIAVLAQAAGGSNAIVLVQRQRADS